MKLELPLEEMTATEKLQAMEEIWADLERDPASVPAPAWHSDVLAARKARVESGDSAFVEWSDAKERIIKEM